MNKLKNKVDTNAQIDIWTDDDNDWMYDSKNVFVNELGIILINFQMFKETVTTQERVFLDALLIKSKAFQFEAFYWSKAKIQSELGIKRTALDGLINKLEEAKAISIEVKKTFDKTKMRKQQIRYFKINYPEFKKYYLELIKADFVNRAENVFVKYSPPKK